MKKHSLLVFVTLMYLATISVVNAQSAKVNTGSTNINQASILLLGDSISASYGMSKNQGWVHLVNQQANTLATSFKIINASISGETTTGGLSRLPQILAEQNIDHIIVELGGNDGLRGYHPKKIKNNLLQIIKLIQAKNIPVSLMQIKIPPNYGPRYNQMFEAIYQELAQENNITLLPFFMETIATNSALMQKDGIHPNVAAQPIIAKEMISQIQLLLSVTE